MPWRGTDRRPPHLADQDRLHRHLHPRGTRHDRHPYAYIDWEHAITALDSHKLSCSPSEACILRIAASLGDHDIPVHLARVLGSLDNAK